MGLRTRRRLAALGAAWLAAAGAVLPARAAGSAPANACSAAAESPRLLRCVHGLPSQAVLPLLQRQRASRWCWAAALSMALRPLGIEASQEALVRLWYGSAVNQALELAHLPRLLDREWRDGQGRPVRLQAVPVAADAAGLMAPGVLDDLGDGRLPLVALAGHLVVLTEVLWERQADGTATLLRAVVADPAAADGLRNLRPEEAATARVLRLQPMVQSVAAAP